MQRYPWRLAGWLSLGVFSVYALLMSCATVDKLPVLSPGSSGGDQTVGFKSENTVAPSNEGDAEAKGQGDASTGGVVGKIGGGDDSMALWLAIAGLTVVALSAYPAQRALRLGWNSWRGKSGPRKGRGRDLCVKFSEWDSSPSSSD
jgi:hypothetical protein